MGPMKWLEPGIPKGQMSNELFVAYGPSGMNCPSPNDFSLVYLPLERSPEIVEGALRTTFDWGRNVVIGSAAIENWSTD